MKTTLSLPDTVAHPFRTTAPVRQRSRFVARLLEHALVAKRHDSLAGACHAANCDVALQREIDEWQSFEDGVEG
ncbi:MAG: hypothetical protein BECKG1743D_GA0114223_101634 [Candidatus Kentron sp. G]|nr:MAG: hypothetical protein BECKG1743F_GA0114225_101305 [Candidatus Kentron sp. G]VFM98918.1 MAG: hypothetical protein BECKG1743E_GA0114224_102173 [Candidatus Kentron sp. G]VFN00021.1 MAG: hypothetical protein BECKG1743D_GA0114223_101634 [Candidatus Kentron sp. G]